MWQLSEGPQYRDSNSRIWDIEHHLTVNLARWRIGGNLVPTIVPSAGLLNNKCAFGSLQVMGVEELLLKLLTSN